MNTVLFKNWLINNGASSKVASDTVSRLKKINLALINSFKSSSIDEEYANDKCSKLTSLLRQKNGRSHNCLDLPFNKSYISTYKLSLAKYVRFKNETYGN